VSVLKKLEEKIQNLFEGSFGRAFKSPVQPVELAHKLVKEMGEHKVVSVSRIYAPNEYSVFLSPGDWEQFESYEEHLKSDLAEYLLESARREGYNLISNPIVIIKTDEDLEVGEFGIATRMVSAPAEDVDLPDLIPAGDEEMSKTAVYRPASLPEGTLSVSADEARELGLAREQITLATPEGVHEIGKRITLIGRGKQADVRLQDPNVSRSHAELRQRGNEYLIVDLGSTNGVEVNGKQVESAALKNGDVITMGETRVRFERKLC
jgi:translation elongation factor P/translation initiation factor 5A